MYISQHSTNVSDDGAQKTRIRRRDVFVKLRKEAIRQKRIDSMPNSTVVLERLQGTCYVFKRLHLVLLKAFNQETQNFLELIDFKA